MKGIDKSINKTNKVVEVCNKVRFQRNTECNGVVYIVLL